MTDFQQIIILRNQNKSQQEIAEILDISRRSVIRYLKTGKIPKYTRSVSNTKKDPLTDFMSLIEEKLREMPQLSLSELFEFIVSKGYKGSARTIRRKTADLRNKLKNKEVYFQRLPTPGEVMEGDFTELSISIGGIQRKIYLWICSLPYSNFYFATPYYNCTFECFADGSIQAFKEFGGVANKYRLDNLSPAVSKILVGKERLVTQRFAQFQSHYGFKQDFCNPARGNEKGNIESNNKYFKTKIRARMSLEKLSFTTLESFQIFVWKLCREHNDLEKVQTKFGQEKLNPLPATAFKSFNTEIVKINKYSLFSLGNSGHMYSVPSKYIGLSLEARIYPSFFEIIEMNKVICTYKRLNGPRGLVSIKVEHVISGLLRKPGAFKDWKYRELVFERPIWKKFYLKIVESGKDDKEFLKCINLILETDRENLTLAMELAMDNEMDLSPSTLRKIINNEFNNVLSIAALPVNLDQYDFFINGEKENGNTNANVS